MHDVFELVGQIADTTSTVLIRGETGTGKEQVARAIHQASSTHGRARSSRSTAGRSTRTCWRASCSATRRGRSPAPTAAAPGRFELAHGGTLFLDEIGDVPDARCRSSCCACSRSGSSSGSAGPTPSTVDVRVIAATHQDMEKLVKEGKFREDLYYRLNVVRIDMPPLRERPEDIPVLVAHFCQKFARPGQQAADISPEAMEVLMKCPWPGNVRQLENAIERACVTARDGVIRPRTCRRTSAGRREGEAHPFQVDLTRPLPEQLAEMTAEFEKRYLRKALRKTRGHVGKCADISGLSRRSITDKIAHYKIKKEEFKKE